MSGEGRGLQQVADRGGEVRYGKGLTQQVRSLVQVDGKHTVFGPRASRHQNGHLGPDPTDVTQALGAVHVRHIHVEDHQINLVGVGTELAEGVQTIHGSHDAVAAVRQACCDEIAYRALVINYEDLPVPRGDGSFR